MTRLSARAKPAGFTNNDAPVQWPVQVPLQKNARRGPVSAGERAVHIVRVRREKQGASHRNAQHSP